MALTKQKRGFLLAAPVVAALFLCTVYFMLRAGRGVGGPSGAAEMGLNTQLPKPKFDPKKALMDKMKLYEQADRDSVRRRQFERQDPYLKDTVAAGRNTVASHSPAAEGDRKADELLRQLDKLRESIHQPAPSVSSRSWSAPLASRAWGPSPASRLLPPVGDTPVKDPKVEQLNALLDKVIRVQHPTEGMPATAPASMRVADEVLPADSSVNTLLAVVAEDQTLTTGATIELRIVDSVRANGRVLPAGQLIFGTVSITSDRMTVHITALREGRNLYATDLQVYDVDGLAGIHIPGMLSRDVAKQSADQGVSSLNVLNLDPSLGAQAASAGIQTVKSFVGRKVRQVRVSVKAGYEVLLRPAHLQHTNQTNEHERLMVRERPPGIVPDGPVLKRCKSEGMELALRGIWLADSCLWFGLEWVNRSPIGYVPAYGRWFIRDRRVFRRTAMQELPLTPVCQPELAAIGDDSVCHSWTGFEPFALAKDKELVLEVGEKGGGRVLQLVIDHRELIHAKKYGKETEP